FLDPDTRTGPAKGLTQTTDGGFVYCGRKQTYWNGANVYAVGGTISKINQTPTNKEWEYVVTDTIGGLDGIPAISSLEAIEKFGQSNFIAIGNDLGEPIDKQDTSNIGTRSGLLLKFNQAGQVEWKRIYSGNLNQNPFDKNFLLDLAIDNQNNIVGAGMIRQTQGPNLGWILKVDSNGCLTETNCGLIFLGEDKLATPSKLS